ncbi:pectate lyase-like adhesive domain-containing protein [Carnobacterium gallinarum]|uniref:pectate lyase-like adhesive domain-containing protein n=1 Tax=Carnobacterium gallinarum TaxID=2749 RepID=UPI000553B85A|nr:pectate lyase-like adhesive domain-containing protein [Carnobacterium gallinarum]
MKKNKFVLVGLCALVLATGAGLALNADTAEAAKVSSPALTVVVPTSYTEVNTIDEFKAALKDENVTSIKVMSSIKFTGNITKIPNRDLVINGNADQGVVIDSNIYSIYGKQNTKGSNVFAIQNANITGDAGVGRFFTGGTGNGPWSYGWDVNAKDVTYTGARFVHLSEGTLVFDGTNKIDTGAENAWVHNLVFKAGSKYNGTAATKGQFSAFYFNGELSGGNADGKVQIEDNAEVNVVISPENDKNYFYPVFYDKVYQVNVGKGVKFNVDAAGVAFQFIPRADFPEEPSLNIQDGANVNFNGRGGGSYAAMKIQQYGTNINLDQGSELKVTGNSKYGVIESKYNFVDFNINAAYNFEVTNNLADAPLFNASKTEIKAVNVSAISTWGKTGAEYTEVEDHAFNGVRTFTTSITGNANGEVQSVNTDAVENFQMDNYGKVKFIAGGW